MTTNYDNALDACIGLLMQGESVEECLRRFPEHAVELEADLQPIARSVTASSAFNPTDSARNRARNLMRAAIAQENTADASSASRTDTLFGRLAGKLRGWLASGTQRWAVSAAAGVLLLVAGVAVVASASNSALPGQALYPVKRVTEDVSLVFTFSESDRARRHLELAERRAQEIAQISGEADPGLVSAASSNLESHVASASSIILEVESDSVAAELTAQLRASSSTSLVALQDSPGSGQPLEQVGAAYGQALEETAARQEDAYVAAPPGTLRFQVTDPPPPGVDRLFLEFSSVEIFLPAGVHSRWETVLDAPRQVDLIRSANSTVVLAQADVESGSYSRIRINLGASSIVVGNVTFPVAVSTQAIELTRPFTVAEDELTTLTLDIDSSASLEVLPGGGYSFSPVVKVISDEPPPPSATPTPTPRPEATPTEAAVLEISGTVSVINSSLLAVNGFEIILGPETFVDGTVQDGSVVTVEATVDESGSLLAIVIRVGDPPAAGATPTATSTPASGSVRTVIEGIVSAVGVNQWTVDGRKVAVTDNTVIGIGAALGLRVRVEGVLEADGSVTARNIVLVPFAAPSPTPTQVPGPSPTPSLGATPTPTSTPLPTPTPGAVTVEVTGRLLSIIGALWTVADRQVLVTTSTTIEGVPLVGKIVTVVGILADDGSIVAERVTFASLSATATPTATPTPFAPAPTPTVTPTPTSVLPPIFPTPTATPTPTPLPATATPTSTPTPSPTPTNTPTPSPTSTPVSVTISGQVLDLVAGVQFKIDSTTIIITTSTQINGLLLPGVTVSVTGVQDGDSMIADSITVL